MNRLTMVASPVMVLLGVVSCGEAPSSPAPPPISVRTLVIVPQDVPVEVSFPATIDSPRTVEVAARVPGWLQTQAIADGALVKPGDLLYQVDPSQYRIQLDAANARVAQADAQAEVARAQAEVAAAALLLSQTTFDRNKGLVDSGAISKERWDQLTADLAKSKATADQAAADIALSKANQASAAADAENARLQLSWCTITSPLLGQLGASKAFVGSLVGEAKTQVLNTIVQVDPLWAGFNPSARMLPAIVGARDQGTLTARVELPGAITTARPGVPIGVTDGAPKAEGKLVFFDNQVGQTTDTLLLRVEFPNGAGHFRPGGYALVTLGLGMQKDAILVPKSATFARQTELLVWILHEDGTVKSAVIEPLAAWGNDIIVQSGLKAGERIVTDGLAKLRPGVKVVDLGAHAAGTHDGPVHDAPPAAPDGAPQSAPGSAPPSPAEGVPPAAPESKPGT
ncbi:MAG: efflux RND transporter periplasmic adaptor subunit [Phycisphaerae bacterium]|nr:efflux RND transporter periplasmic adaptor subunit [Phycisphaerae bacterium]